jgi:hypothetical protein
MVCAVGLIDISNKNHDSLRVEQSVYFKFNWIIQIVIKASEVSCG